LAQVEESGIVQWPVTPQQGLMLDFIGARADDHYLNVEGFRLSGPLDLDALRRAVSSVVQRHDVLRCRFPRGRRVYEVLPMSAALFGEILRIERGFAGVDAAVAAGTRWVGRPVVLDEQPPLRVWIGRTDAGEAVILLGGHYLVFDAWSFTVLYDDLAVEYRSRLGEHVERPRPAQYADVHGAAQDADPIDWPELFDRPYAKVRELDRLATTPTGPASSLHRTWSGDDDAVSAAARSFRVTPYVLGAAAMLRALSETLGDPQVIAGSAAVGRATVASANAIGFFATTVFFGADLDDVDGLPGLVRSVDQQLRRWHELPRTQWQPMLSRHRGEDLHPAKFAFLPAGFARPLLTLDGVSVERLPPPPPRLARRPLDLVVAYGGGTVAARLTYRSDAVSRDTAETLVDRFAAGLAEICAAAPLATVVGR
jgi:hypothetical protein